MQAAASGRILAWGLAAVIFACPAFCNSALAQTSALKAAVALEDALVNSIAAGEDSVVAIARVRKTEQQRAGDLDLPFRLPSQPDSPTDPEFIPNEFGAGVAIDASGLILTANHVLGDPDSSDYYVWHQHKPFKADVVAAAPWFDLAVLKIDTDQLKPITLGDAAKLRKGQIVIALGNPYAIARDGNVSASWGIVSNLARHAPRTPSRSDEPLGRETVHHYGTLIQTDAKLNLGYSGGALLNLQGEMIGLTTAQTASPAHEAAAGLAIPVNADFKRVVDALKRGESPEFGFLGVGPEALETPLRQQGLHGARIVSVIAGTPADRAGIRVDDVITSVNGEPVFDNNDLFRRIGALGPGDTAALTIVRGDITDPDVPTIEKEVTVSKKHTSTARPAIATASPPTWRGVRVDYATASPLFSRLVERPPGDSLVIVEVVEDSPAWQAGLREDQFVTHVGDAKVTTPDEFTAAVAGQSGDVTLHVTKSGRETTARTVSP